MSDYGDNIKYKWTPESTTLLVSVWTDKQVQKQLEYAQRPQLIWESVARYMRKKGYSVSAKQCRSRMKQVLVCYREAKRAGTKAGVEQYYESIDKVLRNKRCETNNTDGVDTVDSTVPVTSPPKDVKTNKNLKMKLNKYSEPSESLIRTEALSPMWHLAHEEEYPDSPESNETVLVQPYRTFSPTRDAATNTLTGRSQLLTKDTRRSLSVDEQPMRDNNRPLNAMPNNRFGEMLYQNAVQNVQNQIIQESMQQRNLLHNHLTQGEGMAMMQPEQLYRRDAVSHNNQYFTNDEAAPSKLRPRGQRSDVAISNVPTGFENAIRMQNQVQQTCRIDNHAMPQEPQRGHFAQNLAMNYKHCKAGPSTNLLMHPNMMENRQRSSNYSPESADNVNDAYCQVHKDNGNDQLNDSYEQQPIDNEVLRAMNATTITNNATFNDDTLSIEFVDGSSPSPSDNGGAGTKSLSGNSDRVPNVPARKKKAQKLEHLVLNAITSQTEVVNKILAAQDAMVSRFLDLDRDRQNRLENRLDHLMNVVHATVLKKSADNDIEADVPTVTTEPLITNLAPPPPPGAVPPKLDLVPPKPCRVPCTSANANVELINKNPVQTRPGVVSPAKQPGAIWAKLGPVSQSPFVKAQQQLGLETITSNANSRTQSSAERKIAREMEDLSSDRRALIFETEKFLEIEKYTEEQSENARIIAKMGQEIAARRKLFDARGEQNPGIILSDAFLDSERYFSSVNYDYPQPASSSNAFGVGIDDDEDLLLLAGQVDNYERLRRLNIHPETPNKPCDTSTPAKPSVTRNFSNEDHKTERAPKQTIQQLAQLVAKSARWRDAAADESTTNRFAPTFDQRLTNDFKVPSCKNQSNARGMNNGDNNDKMTRKEYNVGDERKSYAGEMAERESRNKAIGWLQDRYSYRADTRATAAHDDPPAKPFPMGFIRDDINRVGNENQQIPSFDQRQDVNVDVLPSTARSRRNIGFANFNDPRAVENKVPTTICPRQRHHLPESIEEEIQNYYAARGKFSSLPPIDRNMIDRYVQDKYGPVLQKQHEKTEQQDSDDDDEFLDTTASMQPQLRKNSVTSSTGKSGNCVIS